MSNERGQTTVEYVLLMGVIFTLILTIMNTQAYDNMFGQNSIVFQQLKSKVEFSYRHAFFSQGNQAVNYANTHPSFDNQVESRFFQPAEEYPVAP